MRVDTKKPSKECVSFLLSLFPREELRKLARVAGVERGRGKDDVIESLAQAVKDEKLNVHIEMNIGLNSPDDKNFIGKMNPDPEEFRIGQEWRDNIEIEEDPEKELVEEMVGRTEESSVQCTSLHGLLDSRISAHQDRGRVIGKSE